MREEIEHLKHELLKIQTERDDLRDRMFNNEKEIQQNNKILHL